MRLSAPTKMVFYIAVGLMAFGIIAHFTDLLDADGNIAILAMAGGGILLTLGNLLKGL